MDEGEKSLKNQFHGYLLSSVRKQLETSLVFLFIDLSWGLIPDVKLPLQFSHCEMLSNGK